VGREGASRRLTAEAIESSRWLVRSGSALRPWREPVTLSAQIA
jgi:hypothetical protein